MKVCRGYCSVGWGNRTLKCGVGELDIEVWFGRLKYWARLEIAVWGRECGVGYTSVAVVLRVRADVTTETACVG